MRAIAPVSLSCPSRASEGASQVKVDKTLAASIALHVLVIGWGLVSFSARSLEAPQPEAMPGDIISAHQGAKGPAGIRTGEKDKPKPLVEKIAEAQPVDDAVGKITKKEAIVTNAAPDQTPPVEKPVEKKPEPPKPVAKDEPKPDEKNAGPAQGVSVRRSPEIRRGQEADAEAASQGRAAAAAEAEAGTHLRPVEDRRPARD